MTVSTQSTWLRLWTSQIFSLYLNAIKLIHSIKTGQPFHSKRPTVPQSWAAPYAGYGGWIMVCSVKVCGLYIQPASLTYPRGCLCTISMSRIMEQENNLSVKLEITVDIGLVGAGEVGPTHCMVLGILEEISELENINVVTHKNEYASETADWKSKYDGLNQTGKGF